LRYSLMNFLPLLVVERPPFISINPSRFISCRWIRNRSEGIFTLFCTQVILTSLRRLSYCLMEQRISQ
jgi:hypothetical protein